MSCRSSLSFSDVAAVAPSVLQDKEGAFMVRDSSTADTYTVSVFTKSAAG